MYFDCDLLQGELDHLMSSNKFERIWLLLTCIITNSCDDDHNHVCNTTNFDNSSTVADGLQQATQICDRISSKRYCLL